MPSGIARCTSYFSQEPTMKQMSGSTFASIARTLSSRTTSACVRGSSCLQWLRVLSVAIPLCSLHPHANASAASIDANAAAAPTYHVGDRWTYEGEDGFRVKDRWLESQEVIASDGRATTVRVTSQSGEGETTRTEVWPGPGEIGVGALP